MEIFNNLQRPNYHEIVSYGPKWWTEFKEMDANYQYAGWTLDLMAYWLERIVNNQFPAHADENAILLFEKLLNIEPEPGETLEERRRTVAAYYSGTGKLSRSTIQSIIKSYTGCDSELWWIGLSLQIRIFCDEGGAFSNRKIHSIISRRIPAHIPFVTRDVLCTFELAEDILFDKTVYKIPLSWWDGVLDGRYSLEGALQLKGAFPPFFAYKLPIEVIEAVKIENTAFGFVQHIENNFSTDIKPVHRVLLNWWEELNTLDGTKKLDGSYELNQISPPYLTRQSHRMEIMQEESFKVLMYDRRKSKFLDGTNYLDGSIKLNSGKEVL